MLEKRWQFLLGFRRQDRLICRSLQILIFLRMRILKVVSVSSLKWKIAFSVLFYESRRVCDWRNKWILCLMFNTSILKCSHLKH